MLNTVGERIKAAIKNSGLTQAAVAEHCQVTKQAITGWIKNSSIDKNNLLTLSKVTNTDYEWLLNGDNSATPPGIKEQKTHYAPAKVDKTLLAKAIKLVELVIEKHQYRIGDEEKAGIIVVIYNELLHGEDIADREIGLLLKASKHDDG